MAPVPERDVPLSPALRLLRTLVVILLVSMIAGVIAVVWLLVTRLPAALDRAAEERGPNGSAVADAPLTLPERITLPSGEEARAVTRMEAGQVLVLTQSGRVLAFGADGQLQAEARLQTAP